MTVHVDARRRRAMLRGLVGFVNRDARSLVRDLVELEFLPPSVDVEAATSALADVFDGVERETRTQTKTKESEESAVRAKNKNKNVRGTNDFLGVVSQLGAALYEHEFRLPPYFARVLRALAALEGVAVGVDADFKVIERVYPYVLARLVRDPDPETRETLKRLVLAPDGESVRWRRVARVFSAVADGFKRRNPETETGPPRDEEKDDVSSGTTREFSTRAFPFPFRCGEDVADVAKKVAETALALAEGADELARDGCARDGSSAATFRGGDGPQRVRRNSRNRNRRRRRCRLGRLGCARRDGTRHVPGGDASARRARQGRARSLRRRLLFGAARERREEKRRSARRALSRGGRFLRRNDRHRRTFFSRKKKRTPRARPRVFAGPRGLRARGVRRRASNLGARDRGDGGEAGRRGDVVFLRTGNRRARDARKRAGRAAKALKAFEKAL